MIEQTWWQRFRAWLAYLIFPEPSNWYVEACERADKLEAKNEALKKILWKCRHGGKGGIPVDYQAEVDALLQDSK